MFGRSFSDYEIKPQAKGNTIAEELPPPSVDQAEEVFVLHGRVLKSLGWLARNKPDALEMLMDSMDPDKEQFPAVCAVYNNYQHRIENAVSRRNLVGQVATVAAFERRKKCLV